MVSKIRINQTIMAAILKNCKEITKILIFAKNEGQNACISKFCLRKHSSEKFDYHYHHPNSPKKYFLAMNSDFIIFFPKIH